MFCLLLSGIFFLLSSDTLLVLSFLALLFEFLLLLQLFSFDFSLHPLKLIKTIFDLEHDVISLLLLDFEFLGKMMVLFIGLFHTLLILLCDLDDFLNRYSICALSIFLIDIDHPSNFLFESKRLIFVIIHKLGGL